MTFIKVEEEHDINAVFLASLAIHESGWGNSKIAQDKNNLFGWGAKNSSPYTSAWSFSSKEECVEVVGAKIAQNYLAIGLDTLTEINAKYCPNDQGEWSMKVENIMKKVGK